MCSWVFSVHPLCLMAVSYGSEYRRISATLHFKKDKTTNLFCQYALQSLSIIRYHWLVSKNHPVLSKSLCLVQDVQCDKCGWVTVRQSQTKRPIARDRKWYFACLWHFAFIPSKLIWPAWVSAPDCNTLRGHPAPITLLWSPVAIYSQNPLVKLAKG